ncbi:MAG TPA: carboxypeptidase-like regulatory domain-containing protein [Niastella sp.]
MAYRLTLPTARSCPFICHKKLTNEKNCIHICRIVIIAFLPWYSLAQNAIPTINSVLHGKVTDAKKNIPLEGASVSIKNTTHTVFTNSDGSFTFRTGQILPYVLVITHVGYKPQTITVRTEDIEIKLEELATQLEDVVVTGVAEGTSRKKLSFALTKVGNEQLNTVPASGVTADYTMATVTGGYYNQLVSNLVQRNTDGSGYLAPDIKVAWLADKTGNTPKFYPAIGVLSPISSNDKRFAQYFGYSPSFGIMLESRGRGLFTNISKTK